MNILVRLPNWLGDVVMSTAFLQELHKLEPEAKIDIIIKKELAGLTDYLPNIGKAYLFSKKENPGLLGNIKFGKHIARHQQYDLYICLPNSFSSALMGYSAGCKTRIGFKNEFRSMLLNHSYKKQPSLHRVEEYIYLLEEFYAQKITNSSTYINYSETEKILYEDSDKKNIVINFNSEAQSRRMPVRKAVSIVDSLRQAYNGDIFLIGSPKEYEFVSEIYTHFKMFSNISNLAGKTDLGQIIKLIKNTDLMISTDSGPAHLANSLGTKLIVLFGAGNEKKTGPYNTQQTKIIRLNQLPCEPCESNICKFGEPKCLLELDVDLITRTALDLLKT